MTQPPCGAFSKPDTLDFSSGAISRTKLMTRPVFQLLEATSEFLRAEYETLFETFIVK
jgi:hypothetical protein